MKEDKKELHSEKIEIILIARDGYPLEQFKGRPIINFFRRLFLGHPECKSCWQNRMRIKVFDNDKKWDAGWICENCSASNQYIYSRCFNCYLRSDNKDNE